MKSPGKPPGHSIGPQPVERPPTERLPIELCPWIAPNDPIPCTASLIEDDPSAPVAAPGSPQSPASLARYAVATMQLPLPEIGLTPPPNLAEPNTLVFTATHIWLTPAGQAAMGPHVATATDGPLTVTLTAQLANLALTTDEGPATASRCTPATLRSGPPADPLGAPACGHTWATLGTHDLTITYNWDIAWTGGGQTGSLTAQTTASHTIAVTDRPITLR